MLTMRKRQFRPVLVKYMELAIDVVLYQQQDFLGHFLAIAVDQFDAVIVVGIMAGRDHDAAVEVVHAGNISYRRRSSDVQQIGVCAGSSQTSNQAILEHIGAATSVFTNDDSCRLVVAVALAQCVIIPAKEAANLVGMVGGQVNTSFSTEAIGSKILSHYSFFLIQRVNLRIYALAG